MSDASSSGPQPSSAPSASDREAVMAALGDAYAADQLELDELEQRMARVYRATSHDALAEVLRGLGRAPLEKAQPAAARTQQSYNQSLDAAGFARAQEYGRAIIARPEVVPDRSVVFAVMGGAERKGSWVVPRQVKVFAVMGGVELDLREAHFANGVTEIEVFVLCGGVEIQVPTGVRVETNGIGIMGGFGVNSADADPGPDAPVLRINGIAVMGGVGAALKKIKKRKS